MIQGSLHLDGLFLSYFLAASFFQGILGMASNTTSSHLWRRSYSISLDKFPKKINSDSEYAPFAQLSHLTSEVFLFVLKHLLEVALNWRSDILITLPYISPFTANERVWKNSRQVMTDFCHTPSLALTLKKQLGWSKGKTTKRKKSKLECYFHVTLKLAQMVREWYK